jgi:hypothetical protein
MYCIFGWFLLSLYPYLQDFLPQKLNLLEALALGLILGSNWVVILRVWLGREDIRQVQERVFKKLPLLFAIALMSVEKFAVAKGAIGVFWLGHGLILPLVIKGVLGNTKKAFIMAFIILSPAMMFYLMSLKMEIIETVLVYLLVSISFSLFYSALTQVELNNAKNS